jgi:hypothetical protein
MADAGVRPDARAVFDAGVDAGSRPDAGGDAGPWDDAGPASDAGPWSDAGPDAGAWQDAGDVQDGGTPTVAVVVPDAAVAPTVVAPTWATMTMDSYAPPGDSISVMLRLDRIRGTEWAERTAAILSPMPDHKLIIGERSIRFADSFDMLYISTSDPSDVTATTVACTGRLLDKDLRTFLSHKDSAIAWAPVAGGSLGTIRSRYQHSTDSRVYLKTSANSVALANPSALAGARTPRSGDVDAPAEPSMLPPWLKALPELSKATSTSDTPYAIVHIAALPARIAIPRGPVLRSPQQISLYLEPQTRGFVLRGKAVFASATAAQNFTKDVEAYRTEAMDSMLSKALLRQFQVYNLLVGLKLKQEGTMVSFASSLSIADARAIFDVAAEWSKGFFGRGQPGTAP